MITKKEILQKIVTKEIKTLDQIEKKFLKDDDVLKLYLMTFHQYLLMGSNNIKKKLDELVKELKNIGPKKWLESQIKVKKRTEVQVIKNHELSPLDKINASKLAAELKIEANKQKEIIRKEEELIISIMRKPSLLKDLDDKIKKNTKIFKEALKLHKTTYKHIHEDLKNDKEFNLKVLNEYNSFAFKFFTKEIKEDLDIQKAAVLQNQLEFEKVNNLLKNDKEFISQVIEDDPSQYQFISQKLKDDKEFNFELIKYYPKVYSYFNHDLQKDKKFILKAIKINSDLFQYLIPELGRDEDMAVAAINDQDKFDAIDKMNKSLLGNLKIIDKEFILNYLEKKIYQSYDYDGFDLDFIKYLNPELLKDDDIFLKALDFNVHSKTLLNYFDKSLFKKHDKKNLVIEYVYNFWEGNPTHPHDNFRFNHISDIRHFDTTDRQENYYDSNFLTKADIYDYDFYVINQAFSKIKFKSQYLNKYYQKPNEIPEMGFPSHTSENDETITEENDYDDEENSNIRFLIGIDDVYEINDKGENIFSTGYYVQVQMFYSSLKNLFVNLAWQFSNENINKKFIELCSNDKLEDLIHNYSYIFLDGVQDKVDHKKLKKLLIKELNHYLSDFEISIRDCNLNKHISLGESDVDYRPMAFSQFQFFVNYKGINNRIGL